MQMGFTPGAVVQVKESAPFGGPVSVIVRGALLSLRKSEARQIVVIHVEQ